jgi:type VI secretion system protein ImpF
MAKTDQDQTVTQSLIDRLIDREPQAGSDAFTSRAQSVRLLKASLRRDLEWLLNTRRNPDGAGEEYPELNKSLYNYGLPDFSSFSMNSPKDKNSLLLTLESAVSTFEPRLKDIKVSLVDTASAGLTRMLRFQIEGMLMMDPSPEQVSFDTVLQLTSGEYQIRGDRSA